MGIHLSRYIVNLLPLFVVPVSLSSFSQVHQFHETNHLYLVVWYSGVVLAILSFFSLNQRVTQHRAQLYLYLIFLPLVYLFVSTTNLLVFFMCYEFFLLPSFLIIFFGSPNRRGVIASIYFLMWTQVGSFLVFIATTLIVINTKSFLFQSITAAGSLPIWLALIGFGIKIPVWPAHYWLTKTHVEAPTYFSIYLSGFLVKTALYGIWVFISFSSIKYQTVILGISVIGVIDSSLKMWAQVDLKKLVAYGTVQEMNLILIGFTVGTLAVVKSVSLFILAHTLLSTMFFLHSDSLYRRFGSRSTLVVRGLFQNTPMFAVTLFTGCLFFAGIPFTLKFSVEVYVFLQLWGFSTTTLVLIVFVCNWFGLVSFMKNWFTPLFGTNSSVLTDLTARELWVQWLILLLLFLLTFISTYLI